MILTCPRCATRYFVDENAVASDGRLVRCASCAHVWRAEPEAVGAPAEPEPGGEPADPLAIADHHTPLTSPVARMDRPAAGAAGWAAPAVAAGLAALALMGGWTFRMPIVSAWPEAASVYALLGATATASGLAFEDVEASRAPEGDVLHVSARVRNLTGRERPAPLVRVDVRDPSGALVFQAFAALEAAVVGPRDVAPLEVDLPGAPPGADAVELTFEPAEDAQG